MPSDGQGAVWLVAAPAMAIEPGATGVRLVAVASAADPAKPVAAAADNAPVGKAAALASPSLSEQISTGAKSSFAFPTDELLVRKHESAARELLDGLTVTPGVTIPFNANPIGGANTGAATSGSSTVTLDLYYRPVGYWFAQIQLSAYLQPSKRAPWNGDFTYSFGYDDYHPYTFSLVYSNYSNNRFSPLPGDPITRFAMGTVSLGWKPRVPDRLARAMLFDDNLAIDCRFGVNVSPEYDQQDGSIGKWKQSANLGCRYPFTRLLFVDVNFFVYAQGQQPWDPDFTYSFGLADYRSGHFSIQYANYSGNRYPGRSRAANTGRFKDGGLFITWNNRF